MTFFLDLFWIWTCNSFDGSNRTDWMSAVLLIRLVKWWPVFKNSRSWPSLSLAITVFNWNACIENGYLPFPLHLILSQYMIVTHPNQTTTLPRFGFNGHSVLISATICPLEHNGKYIWNISNWWIIWNDQMWAKYGIRSNKTERLLICSIQRSAVVLRIDFPVLHNANRYTWNRIYWIKQLQLISN